MKIAYFDTFSGASGDMILGALLDAGLSLDALTAALSRLDVGHYSLEARKDERHGFAATRLIVHVDEDHAHPHRTWADIRAVIEAAGLPVKSAARAVAIFGRLARAEAAVHGTAADHVHFHEVGAVDSIVDIVGLAVALDLLGIDEVQCSAIPTGSGTVKCAHGVLPVPAPATAELLKGVPLRSSPEEGELTTPTGAAVLTTLATRFGPLPAMVVEAVGQGAGSRVNRYVPNLLRVFIGQARSEADLAAVAPLPAAGFEADSVWVIETNLDDTTAEVVADAAERLLAAGALDVFTVPVTMKKGRSGLLLTCLAHDAERQKVEEIIFEHTGTFGLRRHQCSRSMLSRDHETVQTQFGPVRVKIGRRGDQVVRIAPEFEDCRRAAQAHGVSVQQVMQETVRIHGGATK
jgi:hypothetical protein